MGQQRYWLIVPRGAQYTRSESAGGDGLAKKAQSSLSYALILWLSQTLEEACYVSPTL